MSGIITYLRTEPARVVAAVLALIGVGTAFGLGITSGQTDAIVSLVGAVLAIIGGETVRATVMPLAKVGAVAPRRHYGRVVNHDPRSLAYLAPESIGALASIRHTSSIPVLDQGQVGSCTGNASTKALSYGALWTSAGDTVLTADAAKDETYAVGVYSDAETLDGDGPYPPNDNGSSGLSVAKVLKSRGLISGYTHATSLDATLAALAKQAVIVGTSFYAAMETPTAAGELKISGAYMGGHEYVLDELDVENQRVWMQNSWGDSWGISGRAWMSYATLAKLLADSGDCTVFTPLSQPVPTPAPTPTPSPVDVDAAMVAAVKHELTLKSCSAGFKAVATSWLAKQP